MDPIAEFHVFSNKYDNFILKNLKKELKLDENERFWNKIYLNCLELVFLKFIIKFLI